MTNEVITDCTHPNQGAGDCDHCVAARELQRNMLPQIAEGEKSKALMTAITEFVTDDKTAFRAFAILQKQISRLSDAYYEKRQGRDLMALYYLSEDMREMLDEREGYYQMPDEK